MAEPSSRQLELVAGPSRVHPLLAAINTASSSDEIKTHVNPSDDWQIVLRNKQGVVVLYNSQERTISVQGRSGLVVHDGADDDEAGFHTETPMPSITCCPLCKRPLNNINVRRSRSPAQRPLVLAADNQAEHLSSNYFHLLSESYQSTPAFVSPVSSRPGTPIFERKNTALDSSAFSDGYYKRFFKELATLGRGMSGSVYLCQHVLNGNSLGFFACKKIPVGNNSSSLVKALKEITHLESLRHHNIVAVHHVWLEMASLSHGPPVPCLFALMDYANSGSLEKYITFRGGLKAANEESFRSANERKAQHLQRRRSRLSSTARAPGMGRAVHLFSLEEILSLATDIVSGLAFLHSHNMLHLDLKAENILLHRSEDDDVLIPTAMLSDFGSSEARNSRFQRSKVGTTGTLDYLAPESFTPLPNGLVRPYSAELDLWALGLILHLLAFFELPYESIDIDDLTNEIKGYEGFHERTSKHRRRDLPSKYSRLLERLIHLDPAKRPRASDVLRMLEDVRLADVYVRDEFSPERSMNATLVTTRRNSIVLAPKTERHILPRLPSPPLDVITLQQETRKEANLAQTNALSMLGWLAIRALLTAYISCWKATSSCRYASVSLPNLVMLLGTSAAEHKLNIGSRGSGMVTIAMLSVVIISWT